MNQTCSSLTASLRQIPDAVFFGQTGKMALNQIFGSLVKGMTGGAETVPVSFLVEKFPNMASLQRLAAKEAAARKKVQAETPPVVPPPPPVETKPVVVADPTPAPTMSSKPTLEGAYEIICKGAERAFRKYSPLQRVMEAEDIAQGYFTHYLEKGFHDKFDPRKGTPFSAWIGLGIRRWCTDQLRSKKLQFEQDGETVFRTISGDQALTEDGATLMDLFSSPSEDPLSDMIVEEAMAALDPRTKSIVQERIQGYTQDEIGDRCGISRSRVAQLVNKAKGVLSKVL